jgi:hypothetical protein
MGKHADRSGGPFAQLLLNTVTDGLVQGGIRRAKIVRPLEVCHISTAHRPEPAVVKQLSQFIQINEHEEYPIRKTVFPWLVTVMIEVAYIDTAFHDYKDLPK